MRFQLFILLSTTILLVACGKKPQPVEAPKQFCISDTMAKMIAIDTVKQMPIENALTLTGEVAFDENSVVKVFPNSSGQIQQSNVTLGDRVEKGQILAVIKSADVAGNYSDLTSSDADLAITKRQLDNEEALFKNGIASEREYEEAKQNYEKARAAKEKITDMISINGGGNTKAGGIYYIKAPISGYIVEKKVNAGSFIRLDMAENMFTISALKDVWVWANVFESDINKVNEGDSAVVTTLAYSGKQFYGTINKISQVLDAQNKTLKVLVKLDNSEMLLKPEMFTTITVSHPSTDKMLAVPNGAIVENGGQKFVVVYNSNCDLKVSAVSVKRVGSTNAFISDGLAEGQKVITKHALELFNQLILE